MGQGEVRAGKLRTPEGLKKESGKKKEGEHIREAAGSDGGANAYHIGASCESLVCGLCPDKHNVFNVQHRRHVGHRVVRCCGQGDGVTSNGVQRSHR